MNTLLLNQLREELAKAAVGISEKYRTHRYDNTIVGVSYQVAALTLDQVQLGTVSVSAVDLQPGDVLFLFYGAPTNKWVGRIVDVFDDLNQLVSVTQPYPAALLQPPLTTPGIQIGGFNYNGKVIGIKVGDDGFDVGLDQPKIVTGNETDLFNPLGFFPVTSLKWLGDPANLAPLETPQPFSALIVAEVPEVALIGEDINEVGVVMEHYDNESDSVVPMVVGLSTFSTKTKDATDLFEFTLKMNF